MREALSMRQPVDTVPVLAQAHLAHSILCWLLPHQTVLSKILYSETLKAADGCYHVKGHFNS